ncbi:transporter substrate-binding domain-containing protein [uncultured Eubacterium sp.]|uniref:transporter substrate-binding domain-containing protein n=1 Tax=uncultured Eubacterium sp. TaxID=165185 RepID=UPI00280599F4|nr:transporter substrate-binding domain-containing protein [uncultured Eubacterium sp.]
MKMVKRVLAIILACITVGACFAGCSAKDSSKSDSEMIKEKGELVVAVTNFAPMDYKDKDGNWIGFDADLANMVGEKLGVKVKFVEVDWDNKFIELQTNSIDCIWNGMTITDEVKNNSSVTNAYAMNQQIVVTKKELASTLKTVDDLKGLKFAVENGSAGQDAANENQFNATAVTAQSDALLEVASGSADACIIDSTMASAMIGEGTDYADLATSVVLVDEQYGISFRKGSDMVEKVNAYLQEFETDGTLKKLSEKYNVQLAE